MPRIIASGRKDQRGSQQVASTEQRFAAALTYAGISSETVENLEPAANTIDWNRVIVIAAEWDLEPVVLSNLNRHFSAAMPEEVRQRVKLTERKIRAWAVAKSLATMELAMSLENEGVRTIVLKGPAVGLLAYGDVSLRTFSDVDLLVSARDVGLSVNYLLSRGFSRDYDISLEPMLRKHGHALEFSDGRLKIELHTTLFPRHLRFEIDWREIEARSQKLSVGDGEISAMASDHLLVFLCAHGAKHTWSGVRWIADVANLVERLGVDDVEGAIRLSNRTHSRRLLSLGLRTAERELACDVSMFSRHLDSADVTLDRDGTWLNRFDGIHPNVPSLRYWIQSRERTIDQVMCVASVLFNPTEKDRGRGVVPWLHRPLRLGARSMRRLFK